jgi:hypothetical protein
MSPFLTYATALFMAIYAVVLAVDLLRRRDLRRTILQAVALAAGFLILHLAVGFPTPVRAFGGASPVATVAVTFVCVVLGIAGNCVYRSGESPFSWSAALRPLVVSPIVLLPLLGTIALSGEVNGLQLICFAILGFQNGFFWQAVLDRAKPTTH